MPANLTGPREQDRKKIHLDVLAPLAEAIIEALFAVDEKQIDLLCNSFVREIGLTDKVEVKFTPKVLVTGYSIMMEFSTTFDGVSYARDLHSEYIYDYRPKLADNVNKGAMLMLDIMTCIELFMMQVFKGYTYRDREELKLYSDGVFKLGMVTI